MTHLVPDLPVEGVLMMFFTRKCLDLVLVGIEDILLTTPKVRMDLARE